MSRMMSLCSKAGPGEGIVYHWMRRKGGGGGESRKERGGGVREIKMETMEQDDPDPGGLGQCHLV